MIQFIHLRAHSAFSLSEGAIKLDDLTKLCQQHRMPAIALTDSGNLFGSLEFCLTAPKAGIQPIIGCLLAVKYHDQDSRIHDHQGPANEVPTDTLLFLAQNETGYKNLMKLVSRSFTINAQQYHKAFITYDMMQEHHHGLIVTTAGLQGSLARLLLKNDHAAAKANLLLLKKIFQDRLYIELTRLGEPDEKKCEEHLIKLAHDHNVPLVATNEVYFANEQMYEAHDALLCIAEGSYIHQHERRRLNPNYRFKSPAEMALLFKDIPEALANTVAIARRCGFMIETIQPVLPPFPTAKGENKELTDQAKEGLKQRLKDQVYGPKLSTAAQKKIAKIYQDRLKYELDIIQRMGFAGYYLIVADFIKWAKGQKIPVGPGRGSGAGSLVAWVLTITDIDPIRWNLLFERFLNPERISMPDFDVDFCQDRRDEVIEYVQQKYGTDRVAQIITFGKLQARAVVRDVGRVLGIPYSQVDRISKMVPNNPAQPTTLKEAIDRDPKFKELAREDNQVERLLDIGLKLEGLYRHASTHAAGIVIGSQPLEDIIALYQDEKSVLPATQFHLKYVELAGLVKFDFLGLKTLSVIQRTINLAKHNGHEIDISKISLDDSKTFELLRRVEVVGVFQIESAGMRDVLRRLQPTRFEELIALVALFRPGPMDDIPRYLACKNGEEKVHYLHPLLEDILAETFGVMVYQEQVMQIAQVLAGYSLGEADLLRRAMGKKIKSEMDAQRDIFLNGALKNGIDNKVAVQIFDQAAKFAGYGFNKCHSAPYALIAYQTAYLKANYPVEFMAASMSYDLNNTDKLMIFKEDLKRMNIALLPPDINNSYPEFCPEQLPDGSWGVRYALAGLKNVGEIPMKQLIIERRENGPYKNVIDLARRLDSKVINRRMLENLIGAGTLDCLDPQREKLDASIDIILSHVAKPGQRHQTAQVSLFASDDTPVQPMRWHEFTPWSRLKKLTQEFNAIGFYFSSHPLDIYRESLKKLLLMSASDLIQHFHHNSGSTIAVAGVVMEVKERISKKGSRYAFVQLSDASGIYEVTLFSELYSTFQEHLNPGALLYMQVTGQIDDESLRLTVVSIQLLDKKLMQLPLTIEITLNQRQSLIDLKTILTPLHAGIHNVNLKLLSADKCVEIKLPQSVVMPLDTIEMIEQIPGVNKVKSL